MYKTRSYRKSGFAGRNFHCFSWENSKCSTYTTACEPADQCVEGPPGQIKKCVRMKKVPSLFYMKDVRRCAEYRPVCEALCVTGPAPREIRAEAPEKAEKIRKEEIRSVAKWMSAEFNRLHAEAGPALAREILSRGGIAPYRAEGKEEYLDIPLHLRNRRGLPMDEMAAEMGMDEKSLTEAIMREYWAKKIVRRKDWTEFRDEAYDYILAQQREGTWAGLAALWR